MLFTTPWRVMIGTVIGLLLARLVALLFAARPDNPAIALLLAITAPLVAPLGWLDRLVGQPQWGARLELATLAALVIVLIVLLTITWRRIRQAASKAREHHAQG